MQIRSLKLVNFRNYLSLKIDFSPTLNIIIGKNGMGKTNLVEAIYVLALTKSFRSNNDKLMIYQDKDLFKITGKIVDEGENTLEIILNNEGKKAKINKTSCIKLSDYISKFRVIVFSPDDLRIIKSTPGERRKTLNMQLSQLDNSYLKNLGCYNKLLKQRNSYLKTMYTNHNASIDYLDILTDKLITYGESIYKQRKNYFASLNEIIAKKYAKKETLIIKYMTDYDNYNKNKLKQKYKKSINKDIILGATQIGIHRDDYIFQFNNNDLKDFGSEGEQKNAVITYKLAEIELFYMRHHSYPVLILDDLLSELDEGKIKNILKKINKKTQTFITTVDEKIVTSGLIKEGKIFKIKDGKIT